MDISPIIPAGRQVIEAYGDGGFRISGARHVGSVIVLPSETVPWPVEDAGAITYASLEALSTSGIELLLVGCGRRAALLPAQLRQQLRAHGIVAEAMDTGGACRTYNVLLSEGRRVAAALVAVD